MLCRLADLWRVAFVVGRHAAGPCVGCLFTGSGHSQLGLRVIAGGEPFCRLVSEVPLQQRIPRAELHLVKCQDLPRCCFRVPGMRVESHPIFRSGLFW